MTAPPHHATPASSPLPLRRRASVLAAATLAAAVGAALALAGCGGGALGNADTIANPAGTGGQSLSFVYFQRCINPVLTTPIAITINGTTTNNTCAGGGCHDNTTGTGGALRLVGSAAPADLTQDVATVRATDIYRNFYSAFGETVVGQPAQSRLLNKPLVRGVLHGGGQIFASANDPGAVLFQYWINRPMPQGQNEFSSAANAMFANNDPVNGACNTQ